MLRHPGCVVDYQYCREVRISGHIKLALDVQVSVNCCFSVFVSFPTGSQANVQAWPEKQSNKRSNKRSNNSSFCSYSQSGKADVGDQWSVKTWLHN